MGKNRPPLYGEAVFFDALLLAVREHLYRKWKLFVETLHRIFLMFVRTADGTISILSSFLGRK